MNLNNPLREYGARTVNIWVRDTAADVIGYILEIWAPKIWKIYFILSYNVERQLIL